MMSENKHIVMMDENKQIARMKNVLNSLYGADCRYYDVDADRIAIALHEAGYRRVSEVATEIIYEIDEALHDLAMVYHNAGLIDYFAVCEIIHNKVILPIQNKHAEDKR